MKVNIKYQTLAQYDLDGGLIKEWESGRVGECKNSI